MIINFKNIEDAIYSEIKEEMITCGKFDRETCSRLTKETIRRANDSHHLLELCKTLISMIILLDAKNPTSLKVIDQIDRAKRAIARAEGQTND